MHPGIFETGMILEDYLKRPVGESDTAAYLAAQMKESWFDSLKLGSEVEDNTLEELAYVRKQFPNVKLRFKIGGSGAKNDIRHAFRHHVDLITLPMAESRYAVENFLEIIDEYCTSSGYSPGLGMNVETMTIVNNLDSIKDLLKRFVSITIGRSDLSGSMNADVNDGQVDIVITKILDFFKENFPTFRISIGGKITPRSGTHLYGMFGSRITYLNTKFVYIKPDSAITGHIEKALRFEMALYYLLFVAGYRTGDEFAVFFRNNSKRLTG